MFVIRTGTARRDPRAWLWVMGTVVLPVVLLVGFGPGFERAVGATPHTVSVVIHPDRIQMPDSITSGPVILLVTNRDSVVHGLAVRPLADENPVGKLEAPVRPGARARTQVTLDAGHYRVYCPNAVDKGLSRLVTVTPARSGPDSRR